MHVGSGSGSGCPVWDSREKNGTGKLRKAGRFDNSDFSVRPARSLGPQSDLQAEGCGGSRVHSLLHAMGRAGGWVLSWKAVVADAATMACSRC